MKINLDSFYMVTFRSGAFQAIIGWRVVEYLKAQKERAKQGWEVGQDIMQLSELPDGYIPA